MRLSLSSLEFEFWSYSFNCLWVLCVAAVFSFSLVSFSCLPFFCTCCESIDLFVVNLSVQTKVPSIWAAEVCIIHHSLLAMIAFSAVQSSTVTLIYNAFFHRYRNNAWHNKTQFLIGTSCLAIIANKFEIFKLIKCGAVCFCTEIMLTQKHHFIEAL